MAVNEGSANGSYDAGIVKEVIIALFCIFIVWFISSTMLFVGWLCLGLGICLFEPSSAVCSDTFWSAIHLFYWDLWLKILDPMTWIRPFYEAIPA